MAANTSPIFIDTPKTTMVQISVANTARDGTGTMGTVVTAGVDGSRIHKVVVTATVTTTAGMVRLFIDDGGGNIRLWKEIAVSAVTPSATVAAFTYTLDLQGEDALLLQSGYLLKAATHNAEAINVFAHYGDF
jgi:hypothetical protein